ncbi:MAG: M42 family metallopeptidase [Akkermansia sp.]
MTSDIDLLQIFSDAHGVSGHEQEIRELVMRHLGIGDIGDRTSISHADHSSNCIPDSIQTDGTGSLLIQYGTSGPKIMLAAHSDEIGFMVQQITADGFLKIVAIGGWWTHTLLSQRVTVKTRTGNKIQGVIGSNPPHLLAESQKKSLMPIDALYIDVGASSKAQAEDEFGIHLGDPIAPCSDFQHLANANRVMGKAFDNRAGLAAMVAATRIITQGAHPNILITTATVQEEVGLRGAKTITNLVQPDCAIILEGPPADDTPGFPLSDSQGSLGHGVQVRLFDPTAITNPALAKLTEDIAIQAQIPFQLTVRRSGGTDAGALHLSGHGIPCIVLGIPTRYIHAHNGILDLNDYQAAIALTVELVRHLDAQTVASLTKYI